MDKQGTIYKIENLVNGKVYIGQTVRNYQRRMYEHQRKLRNGYHDNCFLQSAFNKYGGKVFKFSVIAECNIDDIDKLEVKWISYYRQMGLSYNLESGGSNSKELHELTKAKLSEYTKSLGWVGGNHPGARRTICINTGKVYGSIIEASEDTNTSYNGLFNVLSGKNICAKGKDGKHYQFAYYKEGTNYKLKNLGKDPEAKRVTCINTGEVYNSTREAAKKTGAQQSHISLCCTGKRNHAGRMDNGDWIVWVFETDYDINKKYLFNRDKEKHHTRKIKCITTNETFDIVREAIKKYNIATTTFYRQMNKHEKYIGELPDGTKLEWEYA